jgi:uncharacterized SAM-binding protein YcdF (DUF218 family)/lysophospholipase L1-like esterase
MKNGGFAGARNGAGGRTLRLAWRPLTHRRAFLIGILTALAAASLLEHSPIPDLLMRPLMTTDTRGVANAIVVPAAGLTNFCTPNSYSLRRTILAIRLYREGRAPLIVFSGGKPEGMSCAVADVMADLARTLGIPPAVIHVERSSTTTWENALFSAPILQALHAKRILLVTDRLHMPRTEASFRQFGFEIERANIPVPEAEGSNLSMLRLGLREYLALAYYRARGRLSTPAANAPEESTPAAMTHITYPDGPFVVLGASYARGWKLGSLANRPVLNRGVSGQQSFEVLARVPGDVVAERPRAVLLWGHINDIFRSSRAEVDKAAARARSSFEEMVAAARREGIEPIVATEVTIRSPNSITETMAAMVGRVLGRQSYQDYVNARVMELNAWLREWARREGVLLLDFERILADGSGRRRKLYATDDGSHISEAGYAALTAYAVPILEERLRRE